MAKIVIGMMLSLDGFAAGRNGDLNRLYPDLEVLRKTEVLQEDIRTMRMFDLSGVEPIELVRLEAVESPGWLDLRFKVRTPLNPPIFAAAGDSS